jgi:hypothetical protein
MKKLLDNTPALLVILFTAITGAAICAFVAGMLWRCDLPEEPVTTGDILQVDSIQAHRIYLSYPNEN